MKFEFYKSIDGLRFFSFFAVLLFHLNINGFQLGWAGVSVFFVISGFLITTILLKTKEREHYFKNFYIRRSLRIFPIYYALIIVFTILYLMRDKVFPSDFMYFMTYTQNVLWVFTDYQSDLSPFLAHTWSLAIEEQFYLLWPFIIFSFRNSNLIKVSLILILGAVLFRVVCSYLERSYYIVLLPYHMDLLIMGGVLALIKSGLTSRIASFFTKYAFLIGLIGCVVCIGVLGYINNDTLNGYQYLDKSHNYIKNPITANIFFFIGLVSIGLINLCISQKNAINTFLSNKIFLHLGKISYGLYLYHWPIYLIFRKVIHSQFLLLIVCFLVTYIISFISYKLFETYFINLKDKYSY